MPFHIRKVLAFGTTEPWVARLWLGIFQFRDFVYTGTKRLAFDQKYAPVLDNLYDCYRAMILLHKTMAEHEAKVSYQEIFHVQNGTFMVTENIDTQMNEALKNFFIKGNIAINHIFPLSKFMGCNISFIREKEDTKFEQNAAKFLSQVPAAKKLVEMLRKDRGTWFLCFLDFRDKIEHKSPQRLMVQYSLQGDKVYGQFPLIDDIGLVDLTQKLWQDLFTFIEDVIILLFRLKLPVQIKIVIIPEAQRDPLIPIKYAIALDISDVTQPERE